MAPLAGQEGEPPEDDPLQLPRQMSIHLDVPDVPQDLPQAGSDTAAPVDWPLFADSAELLQAEDAQALEQLLQTLRDEEGLHLYVHTVARENLQEKSREAASLLQGLLTTREALVLVFTEEPQTMTVAQTTLLELRYSRETLNRLNRQALEESWGAFGRTEQIQTYLRTVLHTLAPAYVTAPALAKGAGSPPDQFGIGEETAAELAPPHDPDLTSQVIRSIEDLSRNISPAAATESELRTERISEDPGKSRLPWYFAAMMVVIGGGGLLLLGSIIFRSHSRKRKRRNRRTTSQPREAAVTPTAATPAPATATAPHEPPSPKSDHKRIPITPKKKTAEPAPPAEPSRNPTYKIRLEEGSKEEPPRKKNPMPLPSTRRTARSTAAGNPDDAKENPPEKLRPTPRNSNRDKKGSSDLY